MRAAGCWEVRDGQAVRICRFAGCGRVTRNRGAKGWEPLCTGHSQRVTRQRRGQVLVVELESAILPSWQAVLRARQAGRRTVPVD